MCSTFKAALVGAVLARCDHGDLALDQQIKFGESDLLVNSPRTGRSPKGRRTQRRDALHRRSRSQRQHSRKSLALIHWRTDTGDGLFPLARRQCLAA
jgi:hypothetical protein